MVRLYQKHNIRKEKELDGLWSFTKCGDQNTTYSLAVPGCWEAHPDLRTYRGKGFYQRNIYIEEETNLRFIFKGVSHTCEVYFDDKSICCHYNAYTPFDVIVPRVSKGTHSIRVYVDNSFHESSALHKPNDYYTYGGIIRPIEVEYLKDVFVERVQFIPEKSECGWIGKIKILVRNLSEQEFRGTIAGFLDSERELFSEALCLAGTETKEISMSMEFPEVEAWCHANPALYFLCVRIMQDNKIIDDEIERIGFRTVEARGNRILLNGEEVFLKGFNRHEDHAIFGAALPLQSLVEDMELILSTGANMIRTSHYPNDERFLDLCDEKGIMVWEENHARALSLEDMMHPNFDEQCKNCIQEMILNHYNHPSIVIWAILNECASHTKEGYQKYKTQFEQIRGLDSSRLTAFATCQHFKDLCLELPDVVGVNLYPLWYDDTSPEECITKELQWIKEEIKSDKPIIVSETGAGAVYGYRSDTCVKWTEERQAIILDKVLEEYTAHSGLSGVVVWQFCDCRVTEEEWFMVRPKTCNNKGVVDGFRRKKIAYEVVKKHYQSVKHPYAND